MGLPEILLLVQILNISFFVAGRISIPRKVPVAGYFKGDWATAIEDATYWAGHKNSLCNQVFLKRGNYGVDRTVVITASNIEFDGNLCELDFSRNTEKVCISVDGENGIYKNFIITPNISLYE